MQKTGYPLTKNCSEHTLAMPALLLHMLKTLGLTGAFTPSSCYLALAMVRATGKADHVVVVDPGTGPVTRELRRRMPHASLVAVEIQPSLAQQLMSQFSGLDERQDLREVTVATTEQFLHRVPGSRLVQFTSHPRTPFEASADPRWSKTCSMWRNLPRAGVW